MSECDIVTLSYELDFMSAIPNNVDDDIVDTFTRTVANGWGSTDTGQVWSTSGGAAGDYSVNGSQGVHTLNSVNVSRRTVLSSTPVDVDIVSSMQVAVLATGASIVPGLHARWVDASNHYRAELVLNTDQTVQVRIRKTVAGVFTTLATAATGLTHATTTTFRLRFQVIGSYLRAIAWQDGTTPGTIWHAQVVDDSHTTGTAGVVSLLTTGNTNTLPVTFIYDDLTVSPAVGAVQTGEPEVLLSLHEDPWCVAAGTRFDPPDARYAEVSSMLTDGSRYPSIIYNNRVLELRLAVQAANPDALAEQLQTLARQLHFGLHGDGRNIIRFSDKTSEPVYFRTFRVPPSDIDVITRSQRTALVNVDVPAEPFAYGPREFYEPITVTNNPATGIAHPMYFDLTGVKGDVDTPLMLMTTGVALTQQSVVAVRRRGDPDNMPFALQAELADDLGPNTTLRPFDATMSGSGQNHTRTDLTAGDDIAVTFFAVPDFATIDGRGDYRVLIRVRRSNDTADLTAETLSSGANLFIQGDPVPIPKTTATQLMDLGVISIPTAADPVYDGFSGQQVPVYGQNFGITVRCTSTPAGCGTVDIDYILLTPADDAWLNIRWATSGLGTAAENIIDSVTESVWFRQPNGALQAADPSPVVGGFPYISPDETNRIVFAGTVGSGGDSITSTFMFVASYWPRYLNPVRPVST